LYADFNSHVTKNQVVARIDPSLLNGAPAVSEGRSEPTRRRTWAWPANLTKARRAAQSKLDYDRCVALARRASSDAQMDAAKATGRATMRRGPRRSADSAGAAQVEAERRGA